jgi:ribosomal protein S27AE
MGASSPSVCDRVQIELFDETQHQNPQCPSCTATVLITHHERLSVYQASCDAD